MEKEKVKALFYGTLGAFFAGFLWLLDLLLREFDSSYLFFTILEARFISLGFEAISSFLLVAHLGWCERIYGFQARYQISSNRAATANRELVAIKFFYGIKCDILNILSINSGMALAVLIGTPEILGLFLKFSIEFIQAGLPGRLWFIKYTFIEQSSHG